MEPQHSSESSSASTPRASAFSRISDAAHDTSERVKTSASSTVKGVDWKQVSGRSDGDEGYQFGDVSKSLFRGAKDIVGRTKERLQRDCSSATSAADEDSPAAAASSSTALVSVADDSDARLPAAATVPPATPDPAGGGVAATIVRSVGQVFGASKGVLTGAALGVVKGGVALTDKLYETSASKVASEQDRERFHGRVGFAARAAAAEVAPLLGHLAASFAQGTLEGHAAAHRSLASAYETVVPEAVQADLQSRLEQRFGAVMEHLVEPAVLEAVHNLYCNKLKPKLIDDWWMPDRVRRAAHEVCCA